MIRPTHAYLQREIKNSDGPRRIGQDSGVHPNPRFFKYYWWIFHEGVPVEDEDFLFQDEYRLCGYDAMKLLDRLRREGKTCIVYNARYARDDPGNPFDPEKWRPMAPSLDDDADPECGEGFK